MSALLEKPVIISQFQRVRSQTEDLCLPLEIEDYQIQPMADASPPKMAPSTCHLVFRNFCLGEIFS